MSLKIQHQGPHDQISDENYRQVARLLYDLSGIHLPVGKSAMVSSRLARCLRGTKIPSIDAFCKLLSNPENLAAREKFVSALTTNTTQFHREAHHFDYLRTQILPDLITRARVGGRVRIWSAGCSSGEEAYGLAFQCLDLGGRNPLGDLRILATDIDRHTLARARDGIYPAAALRPLPASQATAYFKRINTGNMVSVSDRPRALVSFRHLNLKADWPISGNFDVIFCRNVAIYFDEQVQARLWRRLCDRISPGGAIFIGHSEHIPEEITGDFHVVGNGIFRRKGSGPSRPEQTLKKEKSHELEG